MSKNVRRLNRAGAACLVMVSMVSLAALTLNAQGDKDKKDKDTREGDARRPKLSLKAQPLISVSPSRIVLTAELTGGAKDYEEYYCPTVEWEWGDGTQSESTYDCAPYESGKTEIRRRFTVEHVFRAGSHHVIFRLKRRAKTLATATTNLQVQAGLRDLE